MLHLQKYFRFDTLTDERRHLLSFGDTLVDTYFLLISDMNSDLACCLEQQVGVGMVWGAESLRP